MNSIIAEKKQNQQLAIVHHEIIFFKIISLNWVMWMFLAARAHVKGSNILTMLNENIIPCKYWWELNTRLYIWAKYVISKLKNNFIAIRLAVRSEILGQCVT